MGISAVGTTNHDQVLLKKSTKEDKDLIGGYIEAFDLQTNFTNFNSTSFLLLPSLSFSLSLPYSLAVSLLAFGVVIGFTAVWGMCAGCCFKIKLFWMYVGFLVLVTAAEVAVLVWSSKDNDNFFYRTLRHDMEKSLVENYVSFESNHPKNTIWTMTMLKHDCCGINGFTDFERAKKWKNNRMMNSVIETLKTPLACCKKTVIDSPERWECATEPNQTHSNYLRGCFVALRPNLVKWWGIIFSIISSVIFVKLCCFGLSFGILRLWKLHKEVKASTY